MSKSTEQKRCFWNTCPKAAGYFPEASCNLGKDAVLKEGKGCEWYVNSEVDNFCFWSYLRRVSDKDGFMEPLLQHEISTLLAQSSTKINATYKEALNKMKAFPEYQDLISIFFD